MLSFFFPQQLNIEVKKRNTEKVDFFCTFYQKSRDRRRGDVVQPRWWRWTAPLCTSLLANVGTIQLARRAEATGKKMRNLKFDSDILHIYLYRSKRNLGRSRRRRTSRRQARESRTQKDPRKSARCQAPKKRAPL